MWQRSGLDPITLELIKNNLQAVVDEMAFTLERTCASQLIRDAQDFYTALCDARGDLLAVSITQPFALGTITGALAKIIAAVGDDVRPGDVYITNDPYHGGTHLNDIHIVKPVFVEGMLLGYASTKAHHTDVGGRVTGSMAFDNTEIFQEGLRLPPLKLYEGGRPNDTLFKLFGLNVRFPDVLLADLNAQVTALAAGESGLHDLAREYGAEELMAYSAGLLDYAEALARGQIAAWPDGTHTFEDRCDDDGVTGEPVVFRVTVTKQGDSILVDFAGTSPQVPAAINFPPHEAVSSVYFAVRCGLTGDLPNNSGLFRTVRVEIPEGSILNPRAPAPCSERGLILYRVGEAILGAFAPLVPDGVTAASDGGSYMMRFGGRTPAGAPFLCVDLIQSNWGARRGKDGIDGVANLQVNHTNTPIEVIEAHFPIRVESHTLAPDTGGPGRFRGGLGIERSWRYLGNGAGFLRARSDRRRFPPYGLDGGLPGAPSTLVLERPGDEPRELPTKPFIELLPGDLVRLRLAGGGGWGDPAERDLAAVAADVRAGKVSPEAACAVYGWTADHPTTTLETARGDA